MKSIGEILVLATEYLQKHKISHPRKNAEELLAFQLNLKRLDLYLYFDRPLEEKEIDHFRNLLLKRSKGEPLAYIFSEIDFFNLRLKINASCLIPRQETEILLSRVCEDLKSVDLKNKVALDLCCGSGCLGLGLKKTFSELKVFLSDLSKEALMVADTNRKLNELDVELLQGDLLEPFKGKKADIVLCNPPYISAKEYSLLDREVRDFEPKIALVGGVTGMEFYQRLSLELPGFLHSGAKIYFEIGAMQGCGIKSLFSKPQWQNPYIEKDWAGHDRFFSITYFP